ncbi:MAG: ADP-glyceromanno-heptose 6-epimerase [Bdellovibrionales bacterium]|nr:ADP-glyceromanno-heptose 6-epimerase [Bdellovibrionales bacterium]
MFVVTGANGFIGSILVRDLNSNLNTSNIYTTDFVTPEERPELLSKANYQSFYKPDDFLSELDSLHAKTPLTCIFHMGACSSTTELDEEYLKKVNTDYTKSLFQWCNQNNVDFIYASSGAVYGDGSKGFSDDHKDCEKFTPLNPYGWSKLNFDLWAIEQPVDKCPPRWYGLRFFNVYGPHEYFKKDMASVVFKAYHQIKDTDKLKLFKSHNPNYKDGEQLRDFVYVKDITRWMIELYKNQDVTSGIYNLGFGEARTWLDLANNVFKHMDKTPNIDWIDIPEGLRQRYQYYTKADISKLESQGLSDPQWPLEKGVEDYLNNFLLKTDPYL